MARNITISTTIGAKDTTAKAMQSARRGAEGVLKSARALGKGGSAALKTFAIAATGMNQALSLANKVGRFFQQTIGASIQKSMEFRDANDKQVQQLKGFQREIDLLRARIGDVLLPVIGAITTALGPVIKSMRDWLELNFKWLASGIIENLFKFAEIMVNGVAFGASTAAKAFFGLRMAVSSVGLLLEKFFEMAVDGFASFAGNAAKVANAIGAKGIGKALEGVAAGAKGLAVEFKKSADDSAADIIKQVDALEKTEAMIEKVRAGLVDGIGKAGVAALKAVQNATLSGTKTLAEKEAAAAALQKRLAIITSLEKRSEDIMQQVRDENHKRRVKLIEDETALRIENAKRAMEIEKEQQEQMRRYSEEQIGFAMNVGDAYGKVFHAMLSGQASVAAGWLAMSGIMGSVIIDMAQKAIMAHAVESAAAAFKSQAGIPIVGPFLAAAAAATALGVVKGYINQLPAFATGGEVRGGVPGRDSVMAMLTPGERVLTVQENREMKRQERDGGGQMVNQSTNVSISMAMPMQRADIDRYIRDTITPSVKRLRRMGRGF